MQTDITSNRQLAKNMVFNAISLGIAYGISFFFTPYLIKMVGKEAYGFFPLINNMVGYTAILTSAFGSMAGRFITIAIFKGKTEEADRYFNSAYIVNILLSVIFTVAGIIMLPFLGQIISIPDYLLPEVRLLFILAIAILVISMLTGMFGLGLYVKNRIDLGAIRGMINSLVRVSCIIALFVLFKPSIVYMSVAALVAGLVEMCLNLSFKKRFLPEVSVNFRKYYSWKHLKELFSSGVWNSFNSLSSILLSQLDLLITNIFIGSMVTGDYAIAKTVPTLLLSIMGALSSTFFAQFNIVYAKEGTEALFWQVKKAMRIIAFLSIIPVGFLLVFSKEFFDIWIPGQNSTVITVVSFLTLVPIVINAALFPIGGIYTTTNKLKVPSLVLLASGLLNVLVTFLLLKYSSLGVYSIAVSAGLQTLVREGIFTPLYAARCLGLKPFSFYPTIFRNMSGVLVVGAVCLVLKYLMDTSGIWMFILAFAIASVVSIAANAFVMLEKTDRQFIAGKIRNYIRI